MMRCIMLEFALLSLPESVFAIRLLKLNNLYI